MKLVSQCVMECVARTQHAWVCEGRAHSDIFLSVPLSCTGGPARRRPPPRTGKNPKGNP